MAWLESHQGIQGHPKTLQLASRMGWDIYTTVGRLHCFWWWCLEYAPTGDLRKFSDAILAQSVGLHPSEGGVFLEAMVESEWIDRGKNLLRVHDWVEYAGRYLRDTKFKHKPEKWKEVVDLYKVGCQPKVGRKSADKVPKSPDKSAVPTNQPNQPDQPNLTNQGDGLPEWMPREAWNGFVEMRSKGKTVFTDRARELAIMELEKLRGQGNDPEAVLNQTVMNGWKGLFPIKQGASNGQSGMSGAHKPHNQDARTKAGGVAVASDHFAGVTIRFDDDPDGDTAGEVT